MRIYKRPAPEKIIASLDFLKATGNVAITLVSITATNLRSGADVTASFIDSDPPAAVLGGTQKVAFAVIGGSLGDLYLVTIVVTDGQQEYKDYAFVDIIADRFELFRQGVADRIQDGAGKLAQASIDGCIRKAIAGRYAQVRPLVMIADFAGDGATFEYTLSGSGAPPAFPGWVDGASFIRRIEYPAGEKIPSILDSGEYIEVRTSSTVKKLRLLFTVPATGKTLRIEYSVPHALDGSTVPEVEFEGCVDLAASYACIELAAIYNQGVDPVFGAPQSGDALSKSQEYLALAKRYAEQFETAFGLNAETKQAAATGWTEWPTNVGADDERLTH